MDRISRPAQPSPPGSSNRYQTCLQAIKHWLAHRLVTSCHCIGQISIQLHSTAPIEVECVEIIKGMTDRRCLFFILQSYASLVKENSFEWVLNQVFCSISLAYCSGRLFVGEKFYLSELCLGMQLRFLAFEQALVFKWTKLSFPWNLSLKWMHRPSVPLCSFIVTVHSANSITLLAERTCLSNSLINARLILYSISVQ